MQGVLEVQGLFQYETNGKGLNRGCKNFKFPDGVIDCCCYCIIIIFQLSFVGMKVQLEEVINSQSHLCSF